MYLSSMATDQRRSHCAVHFIICSDESPMARLHMNSTTNCIYEINDSTLLCCYSTAIECPCPSPYTDLRPYVVGTIAQFCLLFIFQNDSLFSRTHMFEYTTSRTTFHWNSFNKKKITHFSVRFRCAFNGRWVFSISCMSSLFRFTSLNLFIYTLFFFSIKFYLSPLIMPQFDRVKK